MRILTGFYPTTTAATSFTTGAIALGDAGNVFIGYTISGSNVAGTISVIASTTADFTRSWTVSNTSTSITSSADGYFNLSDLNCPYVAVVWAYTSGTGNITLDVTVKEPYITRGG